MALDGFQFDKKALGWPHDAKVNSSGDFIAMLVKNNYLPADDIVEASGFMVSNLSDSDPGETAFLRTVSGISPTVVLRKDGQCKSFRDFAAIESFALSPSHEPAWLP